MNPPTTFWSAPNGSTLLWLEIIGAFVAGCAVAFGLSFLPRSYRKYIVLSGTFLGGLYFVLHYVWPKAQDYAPNEIPRNAVESVSFWLQGSLTTITNFDNVLGGMLLGLGITSLLQIHLGQLARKHKDWPYSLTFFIGAVAMTVFGYWDWASRLGPGANEAADAHPKLFPHFAWDFLFSGLFINLDAVMYSIISFFIFSAAYRAFRLRSAEATILLGTAVMIMLSLLGPVVLGWNHAVDVVGGHSAVASNVKLDIIKDWVQNNIQSPSIRAIEFGLGIGLLAMALRLWLGIEKGVSQ